MHHQKMSLDDPAVADLFKDLYRSVGHKYFRIEGTRCKVFPIKQHLMNLGMDSNNASRLLAEANLEVTPFVKNKTPRPPASRSAELPEVVRVIQATIEMHRPGDTVEDTIPEEQEDIAISRDQKAPAKRGPKLLTYDEMLPKEEAKESKADKTRYQFIQTSSNKHGIWDGREGSVVFIACTLAECQEEMLRLRSGKWFGDWGSYKKCSKQEE